MFYSVDLLSRKGALGNVWVRRSTDVFLFQTRVSTFASRFLTRGFESAFLNSRSSRRVLISNAHGHPTKTVEDGLSFLLRASMTQILAHHPEKAKRLTRAKASGMSISEACATIMKPPSPLVRFLFVVCVCVCACVSLTKGRNARAHSRQIRFFLSILLLC